MQEDLTRVDRILRHPLFREKLEEIEELERERVFCRHGIEHLLAVARLAQVYNLEEQLGLSKELIYAAALLHDIGRGDQYRDGTPHDQAGVRYGAKILGDCGFSRGEQEVLLEAIAGHRSQNSATKRSLRGMLYRADKKSRPCFCCSAAAECNWPEEKRNYELSDSESWLQNPDERIGP